MINKSANNLGKGDIIIFENHPYKIIMNEFYKPGKGRPVSKLKMKHLKNSNNRDYTTSPDVVFKLANTEEIKCMFMYADDMFSYFLDDDSMETEMIPNHIIDTPQWLVPNISCIILKHEQEAISITLPIFVDLVVTESELAVKGDTAGSKALKKATLETGATIMLPLFCKIGDVVKIDTRTGEYKSRIN
ncbi:MAG: elongation factor P [Chlamydiia bacterium]|nr:elongation factor P [Chlamydiia bacterium]